MHENSSQSILSLPGGKEVKNSLANWRDTRDADLIPELGRSPGGGQGIPLQGSYLENPHGQRNLGAIVHGLTKSQTECVQTHTHTHTHTHKVCNRY